MTVLPSPIPHPLDYSPFDVPGWAYEALEWVVGFDWPAGNEVATWEVADRWYAVAVSLAEPRDEAAAAASRVLAGYGGEGITADGFRTAWDRLAGDDEAPLNALLQIAHELGELVEGCGSDLEAAKLEAWIEIGLFLIELIGMSVAVALTLGAASPAAGGLIMATRLTIQQIFKRLVEQLGRKALKQTTQRAIKDLTTRQGLHRLGLSAVREGADEMRDEALTNVGVQGYQQTGGRANGFDLRDLGMSAAGGFAGGAASRGAGAGAHGGHGGGNPFRGAGGEVLAEFGAAAVYGELPDVGGAAKAATSGAVGSAGHALPSSIDTGALGMAAAPPIAASASASPAAFSPAELSSPPAPSFEPAPSSATASALTPSPEPAPSSATASALTPSPEPASLSAFSSAATPTYEPLSFSPSDAAASPAAPSMPSPADSAAAISGPSANPPDLASPGPLDASSPASPDATASASSPTASFSQPDSTALSGTGLPPTSSGPADLTAVSDTGLPPSPDVAASPPPNTTPPAAPDGTPSVLHDAASSGPPIPADAASRDALSSPQAISRPAPALAATTQAFAPTLDIPTATTAPLPTFFPSPPTPAVPGTPAPAHPTNRPPSARNSVRSDLDRIADALAPRPTKSHPPPDLSVLNPTDPRPPTVPPIPPTDRTHRPPAPAHPDSHTPRDDSGYFGYAEYARHTHELNRRRDYIAYLTDLAEDSRAKILDLNHHADAALRVGSTLLSADHRRRATELSSVVAEIETQIDMIRTGELAPLTVEVDPPHWTRINSDVGSLAPGGIRTDDISALTGTRGHPPIDRTRHYNTYGGLRPPLATHQRDLEDAVPRDHNGRPARLPDPRAGTWFDLANDGGPEADPTRGLNCVDGVLALYDTYLHARPRVSAPRTFDAYSHGNPDRPVGGERDGVRRIEQTTGATFQNLCPYVGTAAPAQAKPAIDTALQNLTNHLYNSGHGAFAFIVTDLESGGCHSWAAVNQNGTILFLDPQVRRISENLSFYYHRGVPATDNIVSMDALVLTSEGKPAPLPHHGPGQWSSAAAGPSGFEESSTSRDERLAIESLQPEHRLILEHALDDAEVVAATVSRHLHQVVRGLPTRGSESVGARVIDEDKRVKTLGSLARKFLSRFVTRADSPEAVLGTLKDRVRFSVEVPEGTYGRTVRTVLEDLQASGYNLLAVDSFWADHGRHNGLNVNLRTPDGFVIEIQFPTPLSAGLGHETHAFYEAVRRDNLPIQDRVDAFLEILKINKAGGIDDHRPRDLDELHGLMTDPLVDTSFAGWLRAKPRRLSAYLDFLATSDRPFERILQDHGLHLDDVPGAAELGLTGDAPKLRLRTRDDG